MSTSEEVRLSVPIPREMHEKLEILLRWGLKAPTVRMLLQLLLDAQRERGNEYIVTDLIEGRCKLVIITEAERSNFEQKTGSMTADIICEDHGNLGCTHPKCTGEC